MELIYGFAGAVILCAGFVAYITLAPYLNTSGRHSSNPINMPRGNPKILDEQEGFEGTIHSGTRDDEQSFTLEINTGFTYLPKYRHVRYYDWELEPIDKFQHLADTNPAIWIRRKYGTTNRQSAAADDEKRIQAAANINAENSSRTLAAITGTVKELIGAGKSRPAAEN